MLISMMMAVVLVQVAPGMHGLKATAEVYGTHEVGVNAPKLDISGPPVLNHAQYLVFLPKVDPVLFPNPTTNAVVLVGPRCDSRIGDLWLGVSPISIFPITIPTHGVLMVPILLNGFDPGLMVTASLQFFQLGPFGTVDASNGLQLGIGIN